MSMKSLPSSSTSQPNPLDNNHNAATTAASITNGNRDLQHRKMALANAKEHMAYEQISKVCEKLEKLKRRGSETETDELRQNAMELKVKIDSKLKIRPHQNTESDDDGDDESGNSSNQLDMASASDGLMHKLYGDPKFEHTAFERIKVSFLGLPSKLQLCLLCFLNFPEEAIIKKRCLIYWWIGMGILPHSITPKDRQAKGIGQEKTAEDFGNLFFDELIAKGFIEPFYKNCSSFVDSCRMYPLVRSALTTLARSVGFDLVRSASTTLARSKDFNPAKFGCLLNVDENVIDDGPELFAKMEHMKILYLGRWQHISTKLCKDEKKKHHIEITNPNLFDGLKNKKQLRFLCLRGISLITEIGKFISQLTSLNILDLRACHNLEGIPDDIGLLKNLTHLDMSDCYFLNHMPVSLALLSQLQVLKGFVIGDTKGRTCTLQDLAKLQKLRKLHIYTSMKDFPGENDFRALKNFGVLRKLTISWGGSSSQVKQKTDTEPKPSAGLPLKLVKLDLLGFPGKSSPSWMTPANLYQLKKLYIRGGQLCDLEGTEAGQGADTWEVETLRLKYLDALVIDWDKLTTIFPKMIFAQVVKCPKLTCFPGDNGVWIDEQSP